MKTWVKFKHLITDTRAIFLEACKLAQVPPHKERRRWKSHTGRAWSKRTTAHRRLVQAERRKLGLLAKPQHRKSKQGRIVIRLP